MSTMQHCYVKYCQLLRSLQQYLEICTSFFVRNLLFPLCWAEKYLNVVSGSKCLNSLKMIPYCQVQPNTWSCWATLRVLWSGSFSTDLFLNVHWNLSPQQTLFCLADVFKELVPHRYVAHLANHHKPLNNISMYPGLLNVMSQFWLRIWHKIKHKKRK